MKTIFFTLLMLGPFAFNYCQVFPVIKTLRYDEDYSQLKTDSSSNWYKKTKHTSISKDGSTYISLGGEIRYQYFNIKNEDWGKAPRDKDGYTLTRYLAHLDFHAGKYFKTFIQLQSSLANGKEKSPSPVDENQLDLHQAFVDFTFPFNKKEWLTVRFGRQELLYGSQRLVSVRDGTNNRQSFDAAKLFYSGNNIKADLFFSNHVSSRQKIFDDGFTKTTQFWGAYIVKNKLPFLKNIDLYYFGLKKTRATFDDGIGNELRHSLGTRIWGDLGKLKYDIEAVYQFGRFADKDISAWTLSFNTGYKFNEAKLKPEISIKTEWISGDAVYEDRKLQTFNPLFPRGGYFGLASLIGPSNLFDIHPSWTLEIKKNLYLDMDYDLFWRYSKNDGIYAPSVSMIYSGKGNPYKFIGEQLSTDLIYVPNNFLYFRYEFTWFNAGNYLKAAGTGKDIFFSGITAQLKF